MFPASTIASPIFGAVWMLVDLGGGEESSGPPGRVAGLLVTLALWAPGMPPPRSPNERAARIERAARLQLVILLDSLLIAERAAELEGMASHLE